MKNVAGFDVSRLMAGSHGTLGALLDISLKVLPKPAQEITLTFVPKIIAIMLVIALTGPFIGGQISAFANVIFERIENGF